MIAGVSGRLLSASFIRDLLPDIGGCERPPATIMRGLTRWRERVDAAVGPASSARTIADVAVIPLLDLLDLSVTSRTDDPGLTTIATAWQERRGPDVVVVPWNYPLSAVWRHTVRTAMRADARWALSTNGFALRLVDARRSWSREYLELDLGVDDDSGGGAAMLLWTFVRGAAIAADRPLLDRAIELSDRQGVEICQRLGRGVLESLTCLLEGLRAPHASRRHRSAASAGMDPFSSFDQSLTVVYRVLFLLFAEARGMVPTWHPLYRDRYSLGTIINGLLEGKPSRGLWPAVQAICRLAHTGCRAGDLRVNAFNGNLFAACASATLNRVPIPDAAITRVMIALGSVPARGGGQRPLIYRDLDVEQLGSVYEQVLDYEPTPRGAATLLERTRDLRKASGSFYTPRQVTAHLVRTTLGPLVDGRSAEELLRLRILDPAMGSGAFLVAACRYLARRLEDALIREGRWHPSDITAAERSDLRREIASRCLYGVDVNPTAVQLARLSLWLATLAGDKPLSFLDHRLVCGDSLVGARPEDLLRQPPGESRRGRRSDRLPLFELDGMRHVLDAAVRIRERLAVESDMSAAVVREKGVMLAALTARHTPLGRWLRVFDLWCAGWFWSGQPPIERSLFAELTDLLLHDRRTLPAATTTPLLQHAAAIAASRRFLHWPLAFPEVFDDEANPGFDAVVGNPPWDMIRGDSGGDTLRDARRVDAQRLTGFVRGAGIYRLHIQAHANRYQLFVERALQLVRRGGRIGLVLPSGAMTDAGTAPLRRCLFDAADVDAVTGLDNRHAIFPIHRSVRFALMTCTVGSPTDAVACRFGITRGDDLERPAAPVVLSRALLTRISGSDDLGVPEIAHPLDLVIVEGATARHPWLGAADGWHLAFGRELNATDDRQRFRAWRRGDDQRAVLEGKQIEAFRVSLDRCRFALKHGEVLPASARRARLVYRDVASAGNRMTLIAAIAPAGVVTTHTLFCLRTPLALDDQRVVCALMNSFVANFLIRLRVNTHVTVSLISRLPVPVVRRDDPRFSVLLTLARALLDAATPAEQCAEFVELQARVAQLYGLTEEQFARVLETFPLVDEGVRRRTLARFTQR